MTTPAEHPSRIGKYEIGKFLGGGMSRVYRAKDSVLGREVKPVIERFLDGMPRRFEVAEGDVGGGRFRVARR